MEEIEVGVKSFRDNQRSTLLDQFEQLSVEIQLNQAMLRRSSSEPGSLLFPAPLGLPPALVRQPVEQGKRGSSWGLHKMVKKLFRPMFRKKKDKGEDCELEQQEASKDLKSYCKRFSKSVRL